MNIHKMFTLEMLEDQGNTKPWRLDSQFHANWKNYNDEILILSY